MHVQDDKYHSITAASVCFAHVTEAGFPLAAQTDYIFIVYQHIGTSNSTSQVSHNETLM